MRVLVTSTPGFGHIHPVVPLVQELQRAGHDVTWATAAVSRAFDVLVSAAQLPKITLHGLRHTFATLALLDGIPSKIVAEVLGHSSTRVTEDLYQHVTPGMKADATARVAALLRLVDGARTR
jgi:integrase